MAQAAFVGFRPKALGRCNHPIAGHDGEQQDGHCHATTSDHGGLQNAGWYEGYFLSKLPANEAILFNY